MATIRWGVAARAEKPASAGSEPASRKRFLRCMRATSDISNSRPPLGQPRPQLGIGMGRKIISQAGSAGADATGAGGDQRLAEIILSLDVGTIDLGDRDRAREALVFQGDHGIDR